MKIKQTIIILMVIGAGLAVAFTIGELLRQSQPAGIEDIEMPTAIELDPAHPPLPNISEPAAETFPDPDDEELIESEGDANPGPVNSATPAEFYVVPSPESPTSATTPSERASEPETTNRHTPTPSLSVNPAPMIDPLDPHRFLMGGESWYPAGYYPSIAALTADQTDYQNYYRLFVDKLAENNLNLFRNVFTMGQPYGESMTPYLRTGPGEAADGRPQFDLDQFNQAYFDYWREVIEYAKSKGVVVQLTIFDNWHNKSNVVLAVSGIHREWGMKHDFYHGSNNINGVDASNLANWHNPAHPVYEYQKALVRQVVDNLGDLPNIIYEISNENYSSPQWELQLSDYLSEYELSQGHPIHLVMPRDLPNHDSAGGKINDPERVHQELVQNFSMNKPLIADNDGGGHVDPEGRRKKVWAALTAGAHINYFHFELFRLESLNSRDAADGMRFIGLSRKFLEDLEVELRGMIPGDHLVSKGWCFARPGDSYIIYLIAGGATEVEGLPDEFSAYWFNPRDGTSMPAEGGSSFASPDGNDWVLYITVH